jgi:hypothetical protein
MKHSSQQHMKMAALLDEKAKAQPDPKIAKKQTDLANVFRMLARRATAQENHSSTNNLPVVMLDEPGMFEPLDIWEQFLAEVKAMADSVLKTQAILHAEYMIALKKEELEATPSNLPLFAGLIDEPGMFGSTLAVWEQFLTEMEELPDSVQKRQTVNRAKQVIAMKKREYGAVQ